MPKLIMSQPTSIPPLRKIQLHRQSKMLELQYEDNGYELSCEFLRVHSPSAEVKGHGPGQEVLQYGKKDVAITSLQKAGNYALQIVFDDSHDSGIYSWEYLYHLCVNHNKLWEQYLDKLRRANKSRDPSLQVVTLIDPGKPDN
ncbi:MAG: DUF971 domain-containing protein [Exilibacterium sp.]